MPELMFDAATHTYRYDHIEVPSVTRILAPLNNFAHIPKATLEAARQFGVNVHAAVDLFNKGILDEAALDPHLIPYLAGYKKFLTHTGFVIQTSERRVFNHALWYAGTSDITGHWKMATWVVDVKSGAVPLSVGPQLAAYQRASHPEPKRRLCVQLKHNDYKLIEYRDTGDFPVFQSCLNIWKFKHGKDYRTEGHSSHRGDDADRAGASL